MHRSITVCYSSPVPDTRVLRNMEELGAWAAETGRPVFLTVGFFDGVHLGHRFLIEQLRDVASPRSDPAPGATLAITFSNSPKNFHRLEAAGEAARSQNFPNWHYLNTTDEKLDLLCGLGLDAVLMQDYGQETAGKTAMEWLGSLDSAFKSGGGASRLGGIVLGYDTTIGKDMLGGSAGCAELAERLGIGCLLVTPFDALGQHVKSSRIREMLVRGDLDGAKALLGYRYFASGMVERGKGKGKEILGIPTANIYLPQDKLTPPAGIYAGLAELDGECYPAALCLSSGLQAQQTVLEKTESGAVGAGPIDDRPVLEAHLAGFEGDLYGRQLKLSFLKRLRAWQDFDDAEALQEQMRHDISDSIAVAYRAGIRCLVSR